jgi:isoquinoline 1-oxidoreductase
MPENFEPEGNELREAPPHQFALNRRDFLGVVGAGLLVNAATPAEAQRGGGAGVLESRLHIGEDGCITVLTGKDEEGQGALTELAMAAAEELRVPLDRVRVVMGDTDQVPNDGTTAGSSTTPRTFPLVRRAAAGARELLASVSARAGRQ